MNPLLEKAGAALWVVDAYIKCDSLLLKGSIPCTFIQLVFSNMQVELKNAYWKTAAKFIKMEKQKAYKLWDNHSK